MGDGHKQTNGLGQYTRYKRLNNFVSAASLGLGDIVSADGVNAASRLRHPDDLSHRKIILRFSVGQDSHGNRIRYFEESNMQLRKFSLIGPSSILVGILFVSHASGQVAGPITQRPIDPPQKEVFKSQGGLVGSWLGCSKMPDDRPEHGCNKTVWAEEFQSAQNFTLFNADGSVWWHASRLQNSAYRQIGLEWFGDGKKDFEPFFFDTRNIVLRLVAESSNWFEVEINETTRQTKFVHKKDPAWAKTDWEIWLKQEGTIVVPDEQRLRDAPNGKIVESTKDRVLGERVRVLWTDGDWAFVETIEAPLSNEERFRGWIRWKRDRDLLIGCYLNHRRTPVYGKSPNED